MKENWIESTLSQCCDFENGDRGQNYPSRADFVDKGYLFVNAGHLENKRIQMDSMNFISEEVFKSLSRGKFAKGNLLFCLRGSLGKYAIVNNEGEGAIASSLVIVKPKQTVTSDFIGYYFDSELCSKMIMKYAGGAAQPNLGAQDLKKFNISIPPLPEQQQIVAILDEAFAAIDHAKANIEKNIQNAKELFQSKLNAIFSQKGEGWEEKTLGELATFSQGIQVGLEKHLLEPSDGYVRFIRIVDYTQNTEDVRYVPNPGEKYYVNEDDIVMVRYGSPGLIGRGKAGVIANNLFRITIEKSVELTNDFLSLWLSKSSIQKYLSSQGSATMPALNFGQLKIVKVSYPSINKQTEIVNIVENLKLKSEEFISLYNSKMSNLDELKKSILQKAFAGELTNKSVTA